MVKAGQITKGMFLRIKDEPVLVTDREFVNPGKGSAFVRLKLKSLTTGLVRRETIKSQEMVEDSVVEYKEAQYLYSDADSYHFMDNETYDQVEIASDVIPRQQSQWLKENIECTILMFQGNPLGIELPPVVELKVTETAPQPRGATATNQLKEAVVETGARVRVPPFIENDQVVKINPETGEYLGKA